MVTLAPVILIGGITLFCWLIFSVAIYALPVMTGIAIMLWMIDHGSGALAGIVTGLLAGEFVLATARAIFAHAPTLWVRVVIAVVFAAPAAVAGYSATLGLSRLVIVSTGWQTAIAAICAILVGVAAWGRIIDGSVGQHLRPPDRLKTDGERPIIPSSQKWPPGSTIFYAFTMRYGNNYTVRSSLSSNCICDSGVRQDRPYRQAYRYSEG